MQNSGEVDSRFGYCTRTASDVRYPSAEKSKEFSCPLYAVIGARPMNAVTDGATRVVSNPETEGWNRADNFRVARHSAVIRRIGRVLARIARKRCVAHSPRETLLEPKSSGTDGSRRPQREVGSSECEVENAPELGGAFQYHRPYGNGTHGESSRRPLTL